MMEVKKTHNPEEKEDYEHQKKTLLSQNGYRKMVLMDGKLLLKNSKTKQVHNAEIDGKVY